MNKLKSLRLWFAGLRSWDRYWLYGLGAVLALSIALLYGKVTNSDDPKNDDGYWERRAEANRKRNAEPRDEDSHSNTVWDRFAEHPTIILILAGILVGVVVRAKDYTPPDGKW